jgi:hypothetical protein
VFPWLPLATDFETRRHAEATGADADVLSYRVLKQFLAPNLGISYDVPLVDGYENLMTREQALLMGALGSERAATEGGLSQTDLSRYGLLERRQHQGERWALLAATGAGTLLSSDRLRPVAWPPDVRYDRGAVPGQGDVPDLNVYRFVRPLPRVFVATDWSVATGPGDALRRLLAAGTGSRAGPPVVIVAPPGEGDAALPPPPVTDSRPGDDEAPAGPYEAHLVRYDERVVEVETEADEAALLILLDAQAPGWSATVTGAPTPIYTANVAFRAVPIPAGRHLVRFTYTPPGWALGLTLSAAGLFALAAWTAGARWLWRAGRPAR